MDFEEHGILVKKRRRIKYFFCMLILKLSEIYLLSKKNKNKLSAIFNTKNESKDVKNYFYK